MLSRPWTKHKVQSVQPTSVFIIIFDMEYN